MNVYEKLNEARIRFQNGNYKKSGKNGYAGYTYYELSDILPVINQLAKELKFSCAIEFGTDLATLTFIDIEKPADRIMFTSPISEASLKGCHAVQNLGAVETYIKRYLYQNCFEIVESDVLDSTMNPNETVQPVVENKGSKKVENDVNEDTKKLLDSCFKRIGMILNREENGKTYFSPQEVNQVRMLCQKTPCTKKGLEEAQDLENTIRLELEDRLSKMAA